MQNVSLNISCLDCTSQSLVQSAGFPVAIKPTLLVVVNHMLITIDIPEKRWEKGRV